MKITWIGQAGFLIESDGNKILIDPYLSNSIEAVNPDFKRLIPIKEEYLEIEPDVLICTHDHLDHTDPETLKHILKTEKPIDILASGLAWKHIRTLNFTQHNNLLFDVGTEITSHGILFKAVKAVHSDENAIGVIMECEGKKIYITGDTLYNEEIFKSLGEIDLLFVCMNGFGNNMNIEDATRFAKKVYAKETIPMHWGMFEKATADPHLFIQKLNEKGLKGRILNTYESIEII